MGWLWITNDWGREKKNPPTLYKRVPPTIINNGLTSGTPGDKTRSPDVGLNVSYICGTGAKLQTIVETNKFCTMKVVELLKIGGEMLKLMSRNEVNRDDWRFAPNVMKTNKKARLSSRAL